MTSVAGSGIIIIIAIALLVYLCMKGLNLIPASLICAFVVSLAVEGGISQGIFTFFSEGFGGFGGGLFAPFMTGGIFGAMMMATGSDIKIGNVLIGKFGTRFAVYSLGIFVVILSFVGMTSWPFLGAIFAFSLMRACDLPRNVAAVVMLGVGSAGMHLLPGSPTLPNLLPTGVLGTNIYAGGLIGVIMFIVQIVIVYLYVNLKMIRGYRNQGIGYSPTPMEEKLRGESQQMSDDELPSFFVAFSPLVVVIVLCMILQLGFGYDSYFSCVMAQIVGVLCIFILNYKRGITKKVLPALTNGCTQTAVPLVATCAVVGFATIITNTAAYEAIIGAVGALEINPYVMIVIGTAIFAAVSADAISGIAMSVGTLGAKAIEAGANAGLVHRLTTAAATTFDTMPHSSSLNVTINFLGLTHKEVYGQIVVVQIGATSAATLVGMILSMIIG